jgi:hypothetical protein
MIVVDPGTTSEEKILCATQASGNIAVASGGRGQDTTVATSHNAGAIVEHCLGAIEVDDDNAHIYDTTRDDPSHVKYARTDGSRHFTGTVTLDSGLIVTGSTNLNGGASVGGNLTTSGISTAQAFNPTGLVGAANSSRYVGATAGGAPTAGPFAVGDFVIDRLGLIWICTTAGTPGTWAPVGSGAGALPPPVTSGTTIQSFTDASGEVWVAKNGVNGGAWKKARDVLHARWARAAAMTLTPTGQTVVWDTVNRDPYGLYSGGGNFTAPVAGVYQMTSQIAAGTNAINAYVQVTLALSGVSTTQMTVYAPGTSATSVRSEDRYYFNAGDTFRASAATSASYSLVAAGYATYALFDYLGTG